MHKACNGRGEMQLLMCACVLSVHVYARLDAHSCPRTRICAWVLIRMLACIRRHIDVPGYQA